MDWGIHLPHLGKQATGPGLVSFAQRAEALGFHSAWVSDHIAWPSDITSRYPYTPDGAFPAPINLPWLDPIGTLFFVAGGTRRVKVGTTFLILGYRAPRPTPKAMPPLGNVPRVPGLLGVRVRGM